MPPLTEAVPGGGLCLVVRTFGEANAGPAPRLIVFVHGDVSSGGPATYHLAFAEEMGARAGVVGVALIRPGYDDGSGAQSTGSHHGRRDHYTAENNRALAEAVGNLARYHRASQTVLVGHSGGAAQVGAVIGQYPELADAAVLVSCPCDVSLWRSMKGRGNWTRSQSPSGFADGISKAMRIAVVTGQDDDNTFPQLGEAYARSLAARGVEARFVAVPGARHTFNRTIWTAVRSELDSLLSSPHPPDASASTKGG